MALEHPDYDPYRYYAAYLALLGREMGRLIDEQIMRSLIPEQYLRPQDETDRFAVEALINSTRLPRG